MELNEEEWGWLVMAVESWDHWCTKTNQTVILDDESSLRYERMKDKVRQASKEAT